MYYETHRGSQEVLATNLPATLIQTVRIYCSSLCFTCMNTSIRLTLQTVELESVQNYQTECLESLESSILMSRGDRGYNLFKGFGL